MLTRRQWLGVTLGGAAAAVTAGVRPIAAAASPPMTVYKDPGCGCCTKWVEYVRQHGFTVSVRDMSDVDTVKDTFGVPKALRSCHTATIGTYVIEGHVPADLITRLLREHSTVAGLAVPGMVTGSPGMEGGTPQAYDVVAYRRDGTTAVYAHR